MTYPTYLTAKEAASILRVHERTIARMIRRGQLRGRFFAGKWLLDEREVLDGPAPAPPPKPRRRRVYEEGSARALVQRMRQERAA